MHRNVKLTLKGFASGMKATMLQCDVVYSATQDGLRFCVVSGFNETQLFSSFTLRCAKWPSCKYLLEGFSFPSLITLSMREMQRRRETPGVSSDNCPARVYPFNLNINLFLV